MKLHTLNYLSGFMFLILGFFTYLNSTSKKVFDRILDDKGENAAIKNRKLKKISGLAMMILAVFILALIKFGD